MATSHPGVGFVFDIDGVLVRGKNPILGASETLAALQKHRIPFIFLTNGGGHTEEAHVNRLGLRLGLTFDKDQFIQSHTPFHDLVPTYREKTVLVIGGHGHQIRDVAQAYGFKHVVTSSDLMHAYEHIHPFPEMTKDHHTQHGRQPAHHAHYAGHPTEPNLTHGSASASSTLEIAAILVWSSSRDWCLDLQVITDLLLSHHGRFGTVSPRNGDATLPNHGFQQDGQPALHFCNPDLQWATAHAVPRLAQGGFRAALEGVWAALTGGRASLQFEVCGKPTLTTFAYGERALLAWADRVAADERAHGLDIEPEGGEGSTTDDTHSKGNMNQGESGPAVQPKSISAVYMVGDNPESDICGANRYQSAGGATWRSVLVESGVHVAGTEPAHKPNHIARNVCEAVRWALEWEEIVFGGLEREE